jgi:hypothetical protein
MTTRFGYDNVTLGRPKFENSEETIKPSGGPLT